MLSYLQEVISTAQQHFGVKLSTSSAKSLHGLEGHAKIQLFRRQQNP